MILRDARLVRSMKRGRIRRPDVQIAFVSSYWDGPISGVAIVREERVWFCLKREDGPRYGREYWLVRMTEDQRLRQAERQEKFERMVGTHWTYVDGKRPSGGVDPDEKKRTQYYAEQKESTEPNMTFEDNEIIGWSTL